MITADGKRHFVRGDLVDVRSADEILATLDENGTLDGVSFMHEMLDALGKRYRVDRRVEHFSFDGHAICGDESTVRMFPDDDVVVLEGMRCTGDSHGSCKRCCTVFWKEAWLRPATSDPPEDAVGNREALASRLRTRNPQHPEVYFCQSSELLKSTRPVSRFERLRRCWRNVMSGNYGALEMLRNLLVWIWVRGREKVLGPYPVGTLRKTPQGELNLQVGELVEVKSLEEIRNTLDRRGMNRGLHFSPEMIPYCGRRLRVLARADQMIVEGTGQMRTMSNTVILETAICDSATWAFGACPRQDYIYWREIWLKRVGDRELRIDQPQPIHAKRKRSRRSVEIRDS